LRSSSFTKIGGSGDRCRYVNQFDRSIEFGICVLSQWGTPRAIGVWDEMDANWPLLRDGYYSGCAADTRRTGLRGSIYSERRYTTTIIRSYWIITPHLVIPREKTLVDLPEVFSKRGILESMNPSINLRSWAIDN